MNENLQKQCLYSAKSCWTINLIAFVSLFFVIACGSNFKETIFSNEYFLKFSIGEEALGSDQSTSAMLISYSLIPKSEDKTLINLFNRNLDRSGIFSTKHIMLDTNDNSHSNIIIEISNKNKYLMQYAVASNYVSLVDLDRNGLQHYQTPYESPVISARISPNEDILAIATAGRITLYDVPKGNQLMSYKYTSANSNYVSLSFNQDASKLIINHRFEIYVIDIINGAVNYNEYGLSNAAFYDSSTIIANESAQLLNNSLTNYTHIIDNVSEKVSYNKPLSYATHIDGKVTGIGIVKDSLTWLPNSIRTFLQKYGIVTNYVDVQYDSKYCHTSFRLHNVSSLYPWRLSNMGTVSVSNSGKLLAYQDGRNMRILSYGSNISYIYPFAAIALICIAYGSILISRKVYKYRLGAR